MREGVAGPNPVRSAKYAHVGEWLSQRSAKPYNRQFESGHVLKIRKFCQMFSVWHGFCSKKQNIDKKGMKDIKRKYKQ